MTQMTKSNIMVPEDLNVYKARIKRLFGGIFVPGREIFIARAPARLDVMGGIADYSGSVVLEGTLREAIIVGVQKRIDRRILIRSLGIEDQGFAGIVEYHLDDFFSAGRLKTYDVLHEEFNRDEKKRWAAYLLGAFAVLLAEGLIEKFDHGASIGVSSNIPLGVGISSSAALEIATMYAIQHAYQISLDSFQLARSCQIVENQIVGAPCGIMDQITSAMGLKGSLLMLRCQPHELLKMVSVPKGFQLVGINSGIRHFINGSRYMDARVAAFMGRRIIFNRSQKYAGQIPYGGYLCNVTVEEWTDALRKTVPAKLFGKEFLEKYQFHDDPATHVDPEKRYQPRSRTEHPIMENSRVLRFAELLDGSAGASDEARMVEAGQLMYESHTSYDKNCGLGNKNTDLLVQLVKAHGPEKGLYGAKITGGGSGGTVAILAGTGTNDILHNIAAQYYDATKIKPDLFVDSSPGALELGIDSTSFD